MKTIRFDGRAPSVMNVKVGNEGDNLAESIRFELPTWLDGAAPSLYLSTGKYSDVILLGADRTYRPTRTHTQHPGRWTAYLEAQQDGDVVWHSDPFGMIVGDLPDTGEKISQAYPTAVEEAVKAAAQTLRDKDAAEAARKAAEDAADAAGNAAGIARDAADNASSAAQSAAQKVTEINDSTSRIAVDVETLAPGIQATAESSISPADGIRIKLGVPRGDKGDKGDTGETGPQGAPGADAPQIDDTQASVAHPWSGAKVAEEVKQLKKDLSDKLPKSPVNWEPWTTEEQAAARTRMGIQGPILIDQIELSDAVSSVERSVCADGTPYNLKEIYIYITLGDCSQYETRGSFVARIGNKMYIRSNKDDIGKTTAAQSALICVSMYRKNDSWIGEFDYHVFAQYPSSKHYFYTKFEENPDSIERIILSFNSGFQFPAGSVIKIYGVRA